MTIQISNIQLFTLLKVKLGEIEAQAVIDYVKTEVEESRRKQADYISKDTVNLQNHIDDKFNIPEQSTADKIEQTKNDILKWFVGLFITIALMIIGLYIRK